MIYGELDDELRSYVRGISRSLARGDKHLAEDLEQETFVAALQSRPRDPQAMRAWLRSITKNCLRNMRSKTARRPQSVAFTTGVHDDAGNRNRFPNDPVQLTTQAELQDALESAIDRLPSAYAEVISMRIVDGMPPRAIAQELDIPVETVRTRTRRGFDRLKVEVERLNVDSRVLEEPRPLFGLAGFLIPRKRVAIACAVVLPLAAVAFLQLRGTKSGPTPAPPNLQSVAGEQAAGLRELNSAPAATRSPKVAAHAAAPAQVQFTIEDTGGRATVELSFRAADGSTAKAPFTANLAQGETQEFKDLEPGLWSLLHEGNLVEERELLPGSQEWRITLTAPQSLEVFALRAGEAPASGVEIFTRNGFYGTPKLVGTTDSAGRLAIAVGASDKWIAARGIPGESSKALLLDQPLVEASGRLELHLESWPMHWLQINHGADLNEADFLVNCEPDDMRDLCLQDMEGGISGSSCWLPAWVDSTGRFGIIDGDVRKFACVTVDGLGIWTSALIRRFETTPSDLVVMPTWSIKGRLLTADGMPLRDRPVRITTAGRARMSGKEIRTDSDGYFEIEQVTTEAIDIHSNGRHVMRAERPESGALLLGDIYHPASSRRITLSGRVTGVKAPFSIHGLTQDDARQPVAMQLAMDRTRRFPVVRNDAGIFDLHAGPDRTLGIVVSPAEGGPSFTPTFFPRPAEGWPLEALSLHVEPGKPAAQIQGSIDVALLPARLQFQHARTGYRRTLHLDGNTETQDGTFASPPLSDGAWVVSLQGKDGRFAECDRITLSPGETRQLGRLSRKLGHLRLHWPEGRSPSEGPTTRAFIILMEGNEVLYREHVTREFLESGKGSLELPAGNYTVTIAIGQEVFVSRAVVASGALVETTPRSGRMTLDLRLPRMDMIARDVDVRLDVRDPSGLVLDALVVPRGQLADEQKFSLVADRSFPLVVRCSYGGRVIETNVTREMANKSRLVVNLAKAANESEQ